MKGNRGSGRVDWHNENMIRSLVRDSTSQSDVLRKLGLVPASNAVTLRKYIHQYGIDTSHFDPIANRPQTRNGSTKEPLSTILVEHSPRVDRTRLKKRLVNEGALKYKCAGCGNTGSWLGREITLHLEHKNGINNDNRIENLEFLCPNCHSQTTTYAGRNKHTNN
jgi:5-methylcytosine-specific restriction endonuclease McrA